MAYRMKGVVYYSPLSGTNNGGKQWLLEFDSGHDELDGTECVTDAQLQKLAAAKIVPLVRRK